MRRLLVHTFVLCLWTLPVWSQDGPVSPERSSVVPRAGSSLNTSVIGKDDSPKPTAKLAEFIPLAVELSGRVVSLEHRLQSGLDVAAEKKRWAHWQTCIVAVGGNASVIGQDLCPGTGIGRSDSTHHSRTAGITAGCTGEGRTQSNNSVYVDCRMQQTAGTGATQ